MTLAEAYQAYRSPRVFLWVLCIFCTFWVAWNVTPGLPHFDDNGFERLTLILSVEASVASAVMLAVQERQERKLREQMQYMIHTTEAVHSIGKSMLAHMEMAKIMDAEMRLMVASLSTKSDRIVALIEGRAAPHEQEKSNG